MKIRLIILLASVLPLFARALDIKDYLLPRPKKISVSEGKFFNPSGRIICSLVTDQEVLHSINTLQKELKTATGVFYPIAAIEASNEKATVLIMPSSPDIPAQGYTLTITPSQIRIASNDKAGLYYAIITLKQLLTFERDSNYLPALTITDWPDFPQRGVMLDISRDKVPAMESLFQYIDQLAVWKINELQLYTEHTFAYVNHKKVWENASPLTASEIIALDAYCKKKYIRLVPNQNSFAHMGRWLNHDEYKHLAETPTSGVISPAEPGSLKLLDEMYRELLPNFTSEYFNIGCDETQSLGAGKSKEICDRKGKGQVYLDFLLDLKKLSEKNGKKVQFWGDIILNHPEMVPLLPKDITAMIWGYEDNHPFDQQCEIFKKAKIDFYVCPGTSSWNSIAGKNTNAMENLRNAARNGKNNGAKGFLNTDWGDNGHWQPVTVSQPAYLYGAAVSWGIDENEKVDISHYLDAYLFHDNNHLLGEAVVMLGDAYLQTGITTPNSNVFFTILTQTGKPINEIRWLKGLTKEKLQKTINYIDLQLKKINDAAPACGDGMLIKDELSLAAALCRHACTQAIYKLEANKGDIKNVAVARRAELKTEFENLLTRYRTVWMARNRAGGLSDSVDKLAAILKYY